jgi:hypothetical protein
VPRPVIAEAKHLHRSKRDVVEHAHVREQVERLEDDRDPAPDQVDVGARSRDLHALHPDSPPIDRLEEVEAPQQGRLPGSAGADQADDLVIVDDQVDTAQHLEITERFVEPFHAHRLGHAAPSACRRRRSLATSQSIMRASGIVITTK